jgi:DNA topoisomerase-1
MPARWITRHRSTDGGFHYLHPDGSVVGDRRTLDRIRALAVPPAWSEVHIARGAAAAVQAWGIDARGRKQYRYHRKAVEQGDRRKWYRVRRLARQLPKIRARLREDFHRDDLSREQVAAAAVRLLNDAFFRVGSDRYAKENRTFGLTTLRKRHVRVDGDAITFAFTGKASVRQWKVVTDRDLARVMRRLLASPGVRVFRYIADDGWRDLTAGDVNDYVRDITGRRHSAKDFRTWGGTLRFATVLAELAAAERRHSEHARKRTVAMAVRFVAAELGNTPAICHRSYVHPIVVARFLDDGEAIDARPRRARGHHGMAAHAPEERALIRFLEQHFPERRRRPRRDELRR